MRFCASSSRRFNEFSSSGSSEPPEPTAVVIPVGTSTLLIQLTLQSGLLLSGGLGASLRRGCRRYIMQVGMSQELEELPLFPLSTVLFPYATVQLHVFEERYRQLVRDCLQFDTSFGIVLIRAGSEVGETAEPYMVGTTVRITRIHTFDDGRMDIQVQGERRFRIRRLEETKPYLVGFVEPVVELETEDSPRADALVMKAREDFEIWIHKLISRSDFNVQVKFPEDRVALSFAI